MTCHIANVGLIIHYADMTKDEFLAEIDTYCRAAGMAVTPFGTAAVGDPGFVTRLKKGGDVTLRVVEKVRAFMRDNPANPADSTPQKDVA